MPSGARIRANSVFGTVSDSPLTPGATTFNSNQLVLLPSVVANHAIITLDPIRQYGDPEIVIVTAHTAAATVATIQRGAYGTGAREHPQGTIWVHALIDEDCIEILTSASRPTDPYRGQAIFETDTNRYVGRSTADAWQQLGLFFDPPSCRITNSVAQSTTTGVEFMILFDTEEYDTDSMHSIVSNTGRITFNTPGIYAVGATFEFPTNGIGYRYAVMRNQVGSALALESGDSESILSGWGCNLKIIKKFAAGEWVTVHCQQTTGGPLNVSKTDDLSPMFFASWIGRGN